MVQYVGFDSEWSSEEGLPEVYLACVEGSGWGNTLFSREETIEVLSNTLDDDCVLVGHNLRSDWEALGFTPPQRQLDTLTLSWLYQPDGSHRLKVLVPKLLHYSTPDPLKRQAGKVVWVGEPGSDADLGGAVPMAMVPISMLGQYCQADVKATLSLAQYYLKHLPEELLSWYWEVEEPLNRTVAMMEARGIALDLEGLESLAQDLSQRKLISAGSVFKEVGYTFNLDSPQQLGKVLFSKKWETKERGVVGYYKTCSTHHKHKAENTESYSCLCPLREKMGWTTVSRAGFGLKSGKKTPTGHPMVNDEALAKFKGLPGVSALLDYREVSKILGTYLEAFPRYMQGNRLFGRFNPTGTGTGRFSSSDPNLQNIPARGELGKKVRDLFVPSPGNLLVVADLDQIEYRLLAAFAQQPVLLEAFIAGEDVHQATADLLGVTRTVSKTIAYCSLYGGGPRKVAQVAGISVEEATEFLRRYYEQHSELTAWKARVVQFAKKRGYIQTLSGRKRFLPDIRLGWQDRRRSEHAERQAVNSVIQGSAADLMRLALVYMFKKAVPLVLQVHDEVVADCPTADVEQVCEAIRNSWKEAAQRLGITSVPIVGEPKVVKIWGEAKG